jgi:hypothetical protein
MAAASAEEKLKVFISYATAIQQRFSRTILESPPARAITERAGQNTRHPAKSHPDQESLFPSST